MVPCKFLGFSVACCSVVLDVYGFPANFRGLVLRVVRYVLDVYGFLPNSFGVWCCVLFVMCWMFMVSCKF
jgi:hypothetical protein